jgi:G6PDH family F420-dependent oxidoreductase
VSAADVKVGLHLSAEEHPPDVLIATARRAEEAGFAFLTISDHFHPWTRRQGQSAFVWAVLGAIAQVTERVRVGTAVTCPTIRTHPAIVAHAAATVAAMMPGRLFLGVGTGERLNESVHGDRWPPATVRRDMLEEAVEIMRALWTGEVLNHRGTHYRVEHARLYTVPDEPPPVIVSGFGPKSVELAGRIGDGYATTMPDGDLIGRFHASGGEGKPVQAGTKVCFGSDEDEAVRTVHRLWPNEVLPGELPQVLPDPEHFEQATELVTEDMIRESVPCGPDLDRHVEALQEYADAGVDELFVQQIGGGHEDFFSTWAREVLPRFSS